MMGRRTSRKSICSAYSHAGVYDDVSDLQSLNDDIIETLDDSFSRRYDYRFDCSWQLPSPAELFRRNTSVWHDTELMSMKSHLNEVKGRLNSVDIVTWQNHTQVCYHVCMRSRSLAYIGTCDSFFRSNRISNRIGRPIRFRIESSNRIGRIPRKP